MGAKNFKTLDLLQVAAKGYQTFLAFSSQQSSQNYAGDFLKFLVSDLFSKISNSTLCHVDKLNTSITQLSG